MALLAPRTLSVLHIALHELHAWNALTHTFDTKCTLVSVLVFLVHSFAVSVRRTQIAGFSENANPKLYLFNSLPCLSSRNSYVRLVRS